MRELIVSWGLPVIIVLALAAVLDVHWTLYRLKKILRKEEEKPNAS